MKVRTAAVALALLALGGCGDDDDDAPPVNGDETTTTVAGEGSGEPGAATTAVTGGGESTETTTAEDPGTTTGAPSNDLDGAVGSGAGWFLRPDGAATIELEVITEIGATPGEGTAAHVGNALIEVSGKSVSTSQRTIDEARATWTVDDLRAVAGPPDGSLRLLFVHGQYAESDTVLGVAVRADVAAIFVDRVRDSASPLVGSGAIEAAVTTHEVGHLLGLVDLHLDTGREDPEHPGHSANRGSVMYWAVESSLVTDLLTGGPPRDFDDADLADLAAIRSGA
jgi:hypothetical protein